MTVACGGACGRSGCTYVGATQNHVNGHIGAIKAMREGKGWAAPKSRSPSPPSMTGASRSPPGGGPETPFYAPLKDLPAGFGKPEEKGAAAPKAAPPPAGPLFDSTPWWLALGELLDTTLLAEKKVKVHMTEERAKRLDASLQAAGWSVTANPHPVSMPYWAPIAITVFGSFVLPIAIAYVPDLIKKARARAKEAQERAKRPGIPAPSTPGTLRVEVPKEAPIAEEEEEVRMRASPPPFRWAPMPWHEPGSA